MGRNRFPPADSRYDEVSASRSESARTAFSRATSTSSSRPRIWRSSVGSGASSPGMTRLLMGPTLSGFGASSPSQDRSAFEEPKHEPRADAEQKGEQGRDGERQPRSDRRVGLD